MVRKIVVGTGMLLFKSRCSTGFLCSVDIFLLVDNLRVQ